MTSFDQQAYTRAVKAARAGTRWAKAHPDAEPEQSDAAADRYAAKHGADTRSHYRSAIAVEFYAPSAYRQGGEL